MAIKKMIMKYYSVCRPFSIDEEKSQNDHHVSIIIYLISYFTFADYPTTAWAYQKLLK